MSNKNLLEVANEKLKEERNKKSLEILSSRFIERQIVLLAYTIRLDAQDPFKIILVDEAGSRVKADFRRAGRPRTKWYDTTRNHAIKKLIREGHLPREIVTRSTRQEINEFILKTTHDRHI